MLVSTESFNKFAPARTALGAVRAFYSISGAVVVARSEEGRERFSDQAAGPAVFPLSEEDVAYLRANVPGATDEDDEKTLLFIASQLTDEFQAALIEEALLMTYDKAQDYFLKIINTTMVPYFPGDQKALDEVLDWAHKLMVSLGKLTA